MEWNWIGTGNELGTYWNGMKIGLMEWTGDILEWNEIGLMEWTRDIPSSLALYQWRQLVVVTY